MSKIEDLIKQYCPNGVKFKELGEILDYEQPSKYIVKSTRYENEGTPVLTAGQTFVLGYTSETDGVYMASKNNPVIIFDDFTTSFHWVDFDFKVKSSAIKMLRLKQDICFKYVYYTMKTIKYSTFDHSRQWISNYSKIKIPVPPMPVQEEIVKILDTYSELEAELEAKLEAELDARKKQYEYYRNKLLNSNNMRGEDINFLPLSEICSIQRGKRLTKNQLMKTEKYPVFHGGIDPLGFYDKKNRDADTVMVINVGASAGTVGYSKVDFWSSDGCFTISHSPLLLNKFLYHLLKTKERELQSKVRKAGIPTLDNLVVEKIIIPIFPLKEQERIVSILDEFNKLSNEISDNLQAEITARKKQYEYYRNKLLTFKEAV